jgi:hypothetical protein
MRADDDTGARVTRVLHASGMVALAGAAFALLAWMIAWRSGFDCTVEGAVLAAFRTLFALAVTAFLLAQLVVITRVLRGEADCGVTFEWRSTHHSAR